MDNLTAKEILSAYRASGVDAQDPNFEEVLEQCRRDPEMKTWFESEQAFDRQMVATLDSVRGPVEGKRSILSTVSFSQPQPTKHSRRKWFKGVFAAGLAALLLISLSIFSTSPDSNARFDESDFNLTQLANAAMPLHFTASNADDLMAWLASQEAPHPSQLPDGISRADAAGCKIFVGREGSKVSLVCFEIEGQMVHVFSFDNQSRHLLQRPPSEWWQEEGWNLIALEDNSNLIAIATRGDKDSLQPYL